jgi:hypothetical protein
MKSSTINKKVSHKDLINTLKINFPDYSINTHSLNNSIIQVKKAMGMAKVQFRNDTFYALGKINNLYFLYILILAICVTRGGIGALVA